MVKIDLVCPFCGCGHSVRVPMEGWLYWQVGNHLVQDAFPDLSATQREQLISSLCPACQSALFGSDDEDEGDDILACELASVGENWW